MKQVEYVFLPKGIEVWLYHTERLTAVKRYLNCNWEPVGADYVDSCYITDRYCDPEGTVWPEGGKDSQFKADAYILVYLNVKHPKINIAVNGIYFIVIPLSKDILVQ